MKVTLIIFTDLDGTLLDHDTYSYSAAGEALRRIRKQGIPLVLVTSKTREETEVLRRRLGNGHPFVVENGAAVCVPRDYFPSSIPGSEERGEYQVISLGSPIGEVRMALKRMTTSTGLPLLGMSDMSPAEVRRLTGLGRIGAGRARRREYTEPFVVTGGKNVSRRRLEEAAEQEGMSLTRGGRFWHLFKGGDKGNAVRKLTTLYRKAHGRVRTVGLGDSPNDLPMLLEVDIPRLVRRPDGTFLRGVPGGRSVATEEIGPAGWNRAVLEIIETAQA
jgi:mannosyl-3-phosphoglycerate phosphatase